MKNIIDQILYWKEKRQALVVAHNYQIPEIQDLADFVGDSLELSFQAAKTSAKLIVFCGVHFMAESAAIFSPDKKILIPDPLAGCSLAESLTAEKLRALKRKYPKAIVVTYINTSAEVKAESDYCVTSTNAVKIVNRLPHARQILFVPDMYLGEYVVKQTGRKNIILYPGDCHIHARVKPSDINEKMAKYPRADFLIHPECGCVSSCLTQATPNSYILSTGGMMKHVKNSSKKEYVIATETGIIYRLKKENPGKFFIPARNDLVCRFMKMITLPKLLKSLKNLEFEIKVPEEIAKKARVPIERMLKLSS